MITDFVGSATIKIIELNDKCETLLELKKGMNILVRGEAQYDSFDHDVNIKAKAVSVVSVPKVVDKANELLVDLIKDIEEYPDYYTNVKPLRLLYRTLFH